MVKNKVFDGSNCLSITVEELQDAADRLAEEFGCTNNIMMLTELCCECPEVLPKKVVNIWSGYLDFEIVG